MNKRIKTVAIIRWIVLAYLLIIFILQLQENIAYGSGLGDIIYLGLNPIMAVTLLILNIIFMKVKFFELRPSISVFITLLFLAYSIYMTYLFTIGRGPEHAWDGNIFV
ncbi:MAG: hypothetical protein JKY54_04385 [Flavobacteriales bacterium]|nr:hypothetical protein [Flavobacteriales bacterium]